jgi:protein tyrosine phosphatase (PTP) superfamily phosphohydrolase (DUF442 family)/cytochrome c556
MQSTCRMLMIAQVLLLASACSSESGGAMPEAVAAKSPATQTSVAPVSATPVQQANAPVANAATLPGIAEPVQGLKSIHNVFRINGHMISGDAPENPAAFTEIKSLGVKTVLSVDGSTPDIKDAAAAGLRYVHIPVTYAQVTPAQQLEIAKAIRDLPGPVYVHCHHGKHRGPAAAASAAVLLGDLTPDQGVAFMKQAGTAASYPGLHACVASARAADKATLDAAPSNFPEIAKPQGLVAAMVNVDKAFDHLTDIRTAGWTVPADHPDLAPAAEAGQLTDNLRFGSESDEAKRLGGDFANRMGPALERASALEKSLVAGASKEDLEAAYKSLQSSCKDCHSVYRDTVH